MSYLNKESAEQADGYPVELFHIRTSLEQHYITNVNRDVNYNGQTYTHTPIRRSELMDSYDLEDGKMTLWLGKDSVIGQMFIAQAPASLPLVTVVRGYMDADGNVAVEDAVPIFNGRITSPKFGEAEVQLECTSIALGLKAVGLKKKYSGNCSHFLYRGGCGVDRGAFSKVVTVTAVVGEVITTDMVPEEDGYYVGGLLEYRQQYRMITGYTGGQNITLLASVAGLQVGDTIIISAGCDHTKETCKNRFNNLRRFGGWSFVPTINYFQTGIT